MEQPAEVLGKVETPVVETMAQKEVTPGYREQFAGEMGEFVSQFVNRADAQWQSALESGKVFVKM